VLLASTILAGHAVAGALPAAAETALPPVQVEVAAPAETLTTTTLAEPEIAAKRTGSADTAALLKGVPGVTVQTGGGVSGLPSIHGMADDRLNVTLDGMPLASACPNHMNPVLSYVEPTRVEKIDVVAGITPVSNGGDSIGGTIAVETARPIFAAPGEGLHTDLTLATFYRSNAHAVNSSGEATVADANYSLGYSGSYSHGSDYHRGGDDNPVRTSKYETTDHALSVAARTDAHMVQLQGGVQFMPYQGFPNQRMDLTDNRAKFANGRWEGQFDWGKASARAYWHTVSHQMQFLDDIKGGDMPMNTDATSYGYAAKAELPVSTRDTVRIGNEFHRYLLNDWWPPALRSASMGPYDLYNIHAGERNRLATFVEWEARWDPQWTSLLGIRNDTVWMDTGNVQAYNGTATYATDVARFNSIGHDRTDVNLDLTALLRYELDKVTTVEGGYARKTRSPSLYERYAWSTGSMAANMNNWLGDGNGYIGNIDLSPEVAHTVSISADLHDPARKTWGLKLTPYYTYVQDYIDADRTNGSTNGGAFVKLKLNNHEAELYGVDAAGNVEAWEADGLLGRGVLKTVLGLTKGKNLDTGDNLYNILPFNYRISLEHQAGGWKNAVEVEGAASKSSVSDVRNEIHTPAYALLNLRTSYEWENLTLAAGIDNVLDHLYHQPLGGADLADTGKQWGYNVPGPGRSYNAGVIVKF
jgi:iron complex outermembrane receptor protein